MIQKIKSKSYLEIRINSYIWGQGNLALCIFYLNKQTNKQKSTAYLIRDESIPLLLILSRQDSGVSTSTFLNNVTTAERRPGVARLCDGGVPCPCAESHTWSAVR